MHLVVVNSSAIEHQQDRKKCLAWWIELYIVGLAKGGAMPWMVSTYSVLLKVDLSSKEEQMYKKEKGAIYNILSLTCRSISSLIFYLGLIFPP